MDRLPAVTRVTAEERSGRRKLQINSYVVAYFRGHLLVCLVDGILIGAALTLLGPNFAAVIGAMVIVLAMIP